MLRTQLSLSMTVAAFALAACTSASPGSDAGALDAGLVDAGESQSSGLEIAGTWTNNFGGDPEVITSERWGVATVTEYDNAANWVVLKSPADDMFNPNKFNKVLWTEPSDDRFFYCWVDYGLDTALAAKTSTKTADASSPETTGCGGFSWTRLERQR